MCETDLTAADGFDLEAATRNGYDTDDVTVNRWSKKGDRLYINDDSKMDKYGVYVDLGAEQVADLPSSKYDSELTLDGDELTIEITKDGVAREKTWTFVVSVEGDGFEADEESSDEDDELHECEECGDEFDSAHGLSIHEGMVHDDAEGESVEEGGEDATTADAEPVAIADGGEDPTEHIDDETIEAGIRDRLNTLGHPDDPDVEEIRDALAWVQRSMEEVWAEWCSNIEHNECEVVYEDSEKIVFATGEENVPRRDLRTHHEGALHERTPEIVSAIHHQLARDCCDYDWSYAYPLVVRKPESFDAGQQYVEAVVNGLQQRGLSPGQAWAYYGVEIRGESRNSWGKRKGDHDHKNVSDALEKARSKLP